VNGAGSQVLPVALRATAARIGIRRATPLGRAGSTFLLETAAGPLVAKAIAAGRRPDQYREIMDRLATLRPPLAPRLIETVPGDGDRWYALSEYAGEPVSLTLDTVLGILERLRTSGVVPDWPLEAWWLDRLSNALTPDSDAAVLLADLGAALPTGPRKLAHGDLDSANVVLGADGPLLVDWEEVGSAPDGFDAGRMLALTRAGHDVPWSYRELSEGLARAGVPDVNLWWFERLGALRLLFRARTLAMPERVRPLVLAAARRAVRELADEKRPA
jgi:hypothetical protein